MLLAGSGLHFVRAPGKLAKHGNSEASSSRSWSRARPWCPGMDYTACLLLAALCDILSVLMRLSTLCVLKYPEMIFSPIFSIKKKKFTVLA